MMANVPQIIKMTSATDLLENHHEAIEGSQSNLNHQFIMSNNPSPSGKYERQ